MPDGKPNILLIILDTLRRDRLSAYGYGRDTSPELDRFTARGTVYERAVAPAQWTVPSHASMFTGLYPGAHGLTQANGGLSGMHPTLAEILHGDGYHTVGFCNNPLVGVLNNGLQRGFDAFYNYASVVPQRPMSDRQPWPRREFERRFRPFARRVGNKFAHNDELFRVSMNPILVPLWTSFIHFTGSVPDSVGDLIDYWGARRAGGQDQPVFAFLNLMGAHLPYQPPGDFLDRVAPGLRHDRPACAFMRHFNVDAAAWASPDDPPLEDWQRQVIGHFYDAEIAYQDHHLGRLLRWLETSGALDDTCVFITADHGEGHGDHRMFGHGFVVHQELVHVPLVARGLERFAPGQRVTSNLSTRRLFHTILDLTGITPPLDEADPNADVRSLSLTGGDAEPDMAFSEAVPPSTFLHVIEHRHPSAIGRMRLDQTRRAVYQGNHKLMMVGAEVEGLYDLAADPAEERNLVAVQPDVAGALKPHVDAFAANAAGPRIAVEIDRAVEEQLRALGYVE